MENGFVTSVIPMKSHGNFYDVITWNVSSTGKMLKFHIIIGITQIPWHFIRIMDVTKKSTFHTIALIFYL